MGSDITSPSLEDARVVIGVLLLSFHFYGIGTIKERRSLLSKLKSKIMQKFPVSVAEVGRTDDMRSAVIAAVAVHTDGRWLHRTLEGIKNHVERLGLAEVVDYSTELLHYS